MPDIHRILDLKKLIHHKSCFLFGPRQTGKSWLIQHAFPDCKIYNLLNNKTFTRLSHSPALIREEIQSNDKIVIIDEIQKLPILLDEVHLMIEEFNVHFLLTGSSARKLRNQGVNLLGGRARKRTFHPFCRKELGRHFSLTTALNIGTLPSIYFSDAPLEDLEAYVALYVTEEIAAEAIVRNIPAFSRFLTVAALCNGKIINHTNIANESQVTRSTVQNYFEILKDTLLGFELPAYSATVKRKPIQTSKFYFFDIGVARFIQKRGELQLGSPEAGEAFESYLFHELRTYLDYCGGGYLHYWRSTSGFEVDFVFNNNIAIEVKAKSNLTPKDVKGLKALRDESLMKRYILVCLEKSVRVSDGIEIVPWDVFLEKLWNGEIV